MARAFDALPDIAAARALLRMANACAPAGAPAHPGGDDLWIYGGGALGKLVRAHLAAVGQPVAGVIDRNAVPCARDPAWAGLPVLSPDAVPEAVKAKALFAVAVVTAPYVPLARELQRQGFARCLPAYDVTETFRDRHPLRNGWFAPPLRAPGLEAADAMLAGLADDASRAHYLRFAAWRLAREEWDFSDAPVEAGTRFLLPEITPLLSATERVLDGGAHHGTVLAQIIAGAGGRIGAAWAVEPDPASRAVLERTIAAWPAKTTRRVRVLDAVLGDRARPALFHAGLGFASQIATTGTRRARLTPIDSLKLNPSFVKLHLEGAELAALEGARKTLLRHRPIVAATIYHNADGLAATPLWLMETLPDYRVLIRTHGWCGTGTVVYAIPKERLRP
ncbi:FkbM family methyltransferase [Aquabacter sp. L1I39]|uniref:FkbM family methyltransferase n=1 Tax=Aquabacter sp. L1I39 TaxID=2820278 RepID=UPI001ADBD616|nr:FkbM family methyltransferase [Aquabacter sp. L1I39]QTL04125.1 FkbM family methyltransferase [Aquabacter sp. L1I39]